MDILYTSSDMHQVQNYNRKFDVYKGFDRAALRKFGKSCEKQPCMTLQLKKIREPQLIIVRNKYTKEVVDLEVSVQTESLYLSHVSTNCMFAPSAIRKDIPQLFTSDILH